MKYDISIEHENKVILCAAEGELTVASAALMVKDVRKQAFELGYNTIYDVTNIFLEVGIIDAYSFPRDIENIYEDPKHRSGKVAILYDPARDRVFWKFLEDTSRNAGANVKVVCSKEEAVNWLSND